MKGFLFQITHFIEQTSTRAEKTELLARSLDRSPSLVIQVFTAVAWQHEVRRCDGNSDSFTARLSSDRVGYPRHGTEKIPLRLLLRIYEAVA
jgi:hypothetical protein